MYLVYYNILKSKYQENIKLVYTNINSYVIKIETNNLYENFKDINNYMNLNNYPQEHPNYNKINKKVLRKFKHKINDKIFIYFIGLKPKAYCYKVYNNKKEHKKSKGVVKYKVSNQSNYKTYKNILKRN